MYRSGLSDPLGVLIAEVLKRLKNYDLYTLIQVFL